MKIGINFMDLVHGKVGGVEKYMINLARGLPKIGNKHKFFYFVPRDCQKLFQDIDYQNLIIRYLPRRYGDDLSLLLSNEIISNKLDYWHCPLNRLDPLNCPIASSFVILDLQHKHSPQFFSNDEIAWRNQSMSESLDRASAVVAISDFTRKDIIRYFDVGPQNVHRIYIDAASVFDKKRKRVNLVLRKYKLKRQYLFYPANTWPHKNHVRLLEAVKDILREYNLDLVLTGYQREGDNIINEKIEEFNLKKYVKILGFVDDDDLPGLYENAKALVFPSLFEGFGIPVVEAMRMGCPVICSSNTSLPEVAGNAALYIDPLSVSDIRNKIKYFLDNESHLRANMISAGKNQEKKFNTDKMCRETLTVFETGYKKRKENFVKYDVNIKWPKISIVTPSYNQGQYIERTIKSVLNQKYPNLEYIVMDGGSKDETINILKKYDGKIIWFSKKDNGQTNAINKGFKISHGKILAYLNSDDTYEPDALYKIAKFFIENPNEKFVFGKGKHIDKFDKFIEFYPSKPTNYLDLRTTCSICQPAAFWKKELYDDIGLFDESCNYSMDYDYWIRCSTKYNLNFINEYLGNTRFYPETKTSGQKAKVMREIIEMTKKHYGKTPEDWIFSFLHAKLEKIDRKSFIGNTIFTLGIIIGSVFGFLKFNHQLPSKRAWTLYMIWIKEILVNSRNLVRLKFDSILK